MSLRKFGKHLKILEFALSSMMRRRMKNGGIIVVFASVVFLLSSVIFLTNALRAEALSVLEGAPQLIVQRILAGRHELIPLTYAETIARMPGVGKVRPRYWGYYYDVFTAANYTLLGAHRASPNVFGSPPLSMIGGVDIASGQRGVCLIGQGVAEVRAAGIDDVVSLRDTVGKMRECVVIGLFDSRSRLLTNDLIVLPEADLKALFAIPEGRATDLVVQVFNPREVDNIARKIRERFSDSRPITRSEILRTYDTLFNWRGGLLLAMCLGAVAAFAILAWDKATGLSADERREIGVLKAIGWETMDILELKFWEGAVIAVLAFLTGVTAGFIHVFYFGADLLAPILKGWSVLFPDFELAPRLNVYELGLLMFFTVVPYIAATIVPSWKAAITDPDQAMRSS